MKIDKQLFLTFKEEEMFPYVHAYLQSHYPSSEGWRLNYSLVEDTVQPDFVVERYNEELVQRAAIEVISSRKISRSDIRNLNRYGEILHGRGYVVEKIFIISSGCDASLVPEDIKIIPIKEFCRADYKPAKPKKSLQFSPEI